MRQRPKNVVQSEKTSRRGFLKKAAMAGGILAFPKINHVAGAQSVFPRIFRTTSKFGPLSLTIAGYPFDGVKGLVDESVRVEGGNTRFEFWSIYTRNTGAKRKLTVEELFHPSTLNLIGA